MVAWCWLLLFGVVWRCLVFLFGAGWCWFGVVWYWFGGGWWWYVLLMLLLGVGWCYLVCLVLAGTSAKTLIMWCVLFGAVGVVWCCLVLFGVDGCWFGVGWW